MPDPNALLRAFAFVACSLLTVVIAKRLFRRTRRRQAVIVERSRKRALGLFQRSSPEPLRKADLAFLDKTTTTLKAAQNTLLGMASPKLKAVRERWTAELDLRKAVVTASAYAFYGKFDRARATMETHAMPSSGLLTAYALQPAFLLQLFDTQDFSRAAVTAYQALDLIRSPSEEEQPLVAELSRLWTAYVAAAELCKEKRPASDLAPHLGPQTPVNVEFVVRWALATGAALRQDAQDYATCVEAYRAIAPHGPKPLEHRPSASTTTYR
jgi:hypothetical protein